MKSTEKFLQGQVTDKPTEWAKSNIIIHHPLNMVDHPSHYTAGEIECIDAIKAALTPEEFQGFCKGNSIKYLWRERLKGGNESLAKSIWYTKMAINNNGGAL